MKRTILLMSLLFLFMSVQVTWSSEVNIGVQINPRPVETVQAPVEDYPAQGYPADEYPAEEYIPEGDPTPPPPLAVRQPDLVVVPSGEAQVYMVPNMVGVYFYGGWWYRFHHGVWFRASVYDAPWVMVRPAIVPGFVVGISPAYTLYLPPTYYRIHYVDFHSHWRQWDHDHRWHRERWFQNERRAEVREARERRAHDRMERDRHERAERIRYDREGYRNRLADQERHDKQHPINRTDRVDRTHDNNRIGKPSDFHRTDKPGDINRTDRVDRTHDNNKTGRPSELNRTDRTGDVNRTGRVDRAHDINKAGRPSDLNRTDKPSDLNRTGKMDRPGRHGDVSQPGGNVKNGGAGGPHQQVQQPKQQPKQQQKPQPNQNADNDAQQHHHQ